MGRQNWKERAKKGPGRKSKKQGDPELPKQLQKVDEGLKRVKKHGAVGGRRTKTKSAKLTTKALDFHAVPPPLPLKKKKSKHMVAEESDSVPQKQVKKTLFDGGSDGSSGKFISEVK